MKMRRLKKLWVWHTLLHAMQRRVFADFRRALRERGP